MKLEPLISRLMECGVSEGMAMDLFSVFMAHSSLKAFERFVESVETEYECNGSLSWT